MAAKNITTNERINFKRYEYLKDAKGQFFNPFDVGVKTNLLQFFHLKRATKLEDDTNGLLDFAMV